MLNSSINSFKNILKNIPGWRTNRNIIVFESDDWGSIRMPSKNVYKRCLEAGYKVDQIPYERYDSLASETDLELLFNVLKSVADKVGNPAVITANVLTSNPNFEKIRASNFQHYSYELITETFKKYPEHANCLSLWKDGMESGVFYPQSHGREHLNVSLFMNALQQRENDVHFGFEHNMPGCIPKKNPKKGNKFVESLRFTNSQDKKEKFLNILEGLDLFEKILGYRSKSFTPPNYLWSPDFDAEISKRGVRYYQGNHKMKEPTFDGSVRYHRHFLGDTNKYDQRYLIRNANFEPSLVSSKSDTVDQCLKEISIAFRLKKPAIICSHRLNYVGFIDKKNRDNNLRSLNELLHLILKKWPNVEFMNSVQLGSLIEKEQKDEHAKKNY